MTTTNDFSAKVRIQDDAPLLELSGDINGFAEDALNAAYTEADQHAGGSITLDFSEVVYINSTGIALIVGLLARARKSKREVFATGLTDHYREIFTITRLSDFMEIK